MNAAAQTNVGKNVLAFAFAIGQRVSIEAIDTKGIAQAITVTSEGTEYRVAYFDDDKVRRAEWLGGNEISRITG